MRSREKPAADPKADPWPEEVLNALPDSRFAPKFRVGDLVTEKPRWVDGMGNVNVVRASDCGVYRVVSVEPDYDTRDRIGEPGAAHIYVCDRVGVVCYGMRQPRVMQMALTYWSERKEEVIDAFVKRLALLRAL